MSVADRLLMRKKLIEELKGNAMKLDGEGIQKRYKVCDKCGNEGCEDPHEMAESPEFEAGEEEGEKEVAEELLASLLSD